MDLYEILGVSKTASTDEIRGAYRKAAKHKHPDAGGSAAEFEILSAAHEVLIDPDKRKRYDATGEVENGAVDNDRARVLHILATALNEVIKSYVTSGQNVERIDLATVIEAWLADQLDSLNDKIDEMEKQASLFEKLAKRFTVNEDGENVMAGLLTAQAAVIRNSYFKPKMDVAMIEGAIVDIQRHGFDAEKFQQVGGLFIPVTNGMNFGMRTSGS